MAPSDSDASVGTAVEAEYVPVVRTSVSPGIAPTPFASDELRESIQTLQELIPLARANLAKEHWDYLVGGSETEATVRRNRMAIECLALRPRVLRKLTQIELGTTLFGQTLSLPLILAPIGGLEAMDPAGAAAAAAAAATAGVMMCLSSACQPGPRETAAAAPVGSPKIFQLYVRGDRSFIAENVEGALACGYQAFCLTVDTQLYSRRERDFLNRFSKPWRKGADDAATNQSASQAALSWDDVEWFKQTYPDLPLLLKGIATAEDAELAVELGVDGVWVSNHGGRQLDAVRIDAAHLRFCWTDASTRHARQHACGHHSLPLVFSVVQPD
jgi:glycolate oxidase